MKVGEKVRYKRSLNKAKNEVWKEAEVHHVRSVDDGDTMITLKRTDGTYFKLIDDADSRWEKGEWRKYLRRENYIVEVL